MINKLVTPNYVCLRTYLYHQNDLCVYFKDVMTAQQIFTKFSNTQLADFQLYSIGKIIPNPKRFSRQKLISHIENESGLILFRFLCEYFLFTCALEILIE